jgi:hypothetical protein
VKLPIKVLLHTIKWVEVPWFDTKPVAQECVTGFCFVKWLLFSDKSQNIVTWKKIKINFEYMKYFEKTAK